MHKRSKHYNLKVKISRVLRRSFIICSLLIIDCIDAASRCSKHRKFMLKTCQIEMEMALIVSNIP